ncbi:MAG: DMT family transporter [Alphaproteobacteria bacterium]|nr:MAG: DMT family transporter [Alphaproteobacteria bacterium]
MNPFRGILLKITAVALFVVMSSLIKATADAVPPGEAVFFRAAFSIPVIVLWLWATGRLAEGLRVSNRLGHLARGVAGTVSVGLRFAGLGLLPLPEVTAISFAAPLFTVVFAALFLGERVRLFRYATVAAGLCGVLVILAPRLSFLSGAPLGQGAALGAVLVLVAAVFAASAQVFIRRLVRTETTTAIVFWFAVTASLLSLLTLPFGWRVPGAADAAMLVMAGVTGGLAQVALTTSYRHADTSLIASFDYVSILFATAIGYAVFDEVPSGTTMAGAAIVVAAGVVIILRERQLGLRRRLGQEASAPGRT